MHAWKKDDLQANILQFNLRRLNFKEKQFGGGGHFVFLFERRRTSANVWSLTPLNLWLLHPSKSEPKITFLMVEILKDFWKKLKIDF